MLRALRVEGLMATERTEPLLADDAPNEKHTSRQMREPEQGASERKRVAEPELLAFTSQTKAGCCSSPQKRGEGREPQQACRLHSMTCILKWVGFDRDSFCRVCDVKRALGGARRIHRWPKREAPSGQRNGPERLTLPSPRSKSSSAKARSCAWARRTRWCRSR